MQKFINPNDPNGEKTQATIKGWLAEKLKLEAVDSINIEEHVCSDASCLHSETIFRVQNREEILFYKIAKPLVFIRKWDMDTLTLQKSH